MNIRKMKRRATRAYRPFNYSIGLLLRNTFRKHSRQLAASFQTHNPLFRRLTGV